MGLLRTLAMPQPVGSSPWEACCWHEVIDGFQSAAARAISYSCLLYLQICEAHSHGWTITRILHVKVLTMKRQRRVKVVVISILIINIIVNYHLDFISLKFLESNMQLIQIKSFPTFCASCSKAY